MVLILFQINKTHQHISGLCLAHTDKDLYTDIKYDTGGDNAMTQNTAGWGEWCSCSFRWRPFRQKDHSFTWALPHRGKPACPRLQYFLQRLALAGQEARDMWWEIVIRKMTSFALKRICCGLKPTCRELACEADRDRHRVREVQLRNRLLNHC